MVVVEKLERASDLVARVAGEEVGGHCQGKAAGSELGSGLNRRRVPESIRKEWEAEQERGGKEKEGRGRRAPAHELSRAASPF